MADKQFQNVKMNITLKPQATRANLLSTSEDVAVQMGKLQKWYESLVPAGGESQQILAWNSDGTAKWDDMDSGYIKPIASKTFTDIIATVDNAVNSETFYFGVLKPDAWGTPWLLHYRVKAYVPGQPTYYQAADVTFYGITSGVSYRISNVVRSTSYRPAYYHNIYRCKEAGISYGHAIGESLYYSTNPKNTSYKRTFEVEILEVVGGTFTFFDNMLLYASIPGTGTTYYDARADYNFSSTGTYPDANTYDRTYYAYLTKAGGTGVKQYSLMYRAKDGMYSSLTTGSGTGTSKAFYSDAQIPYPPQILYFAGSSNIAVGSAVSNTSTYPSFPTVDMRYSDNITSSVGYTTRLPLYLECDWDRLNECFTIGTSSPYKQTANLSPQKYYIYLGDTASVYQLNLQIRHPVFYYDGWRLIPFEEYEYGKEAHMRLIVGKYGVKANTLCAIDAEGCLQSLVYPDGDVLTVNSEAFAYPLRMYYSLQAYAEDSMIAVDEDDKIFKVYRDVQFGQILDEDLTPSGYISAGSEIYLHGYITTPDYGFVADDPGSSYSLINISPSNDTRVFYVDQTYPFFTNSDVHDSGDSGDFVYVGIANGPQVIALDDDHPSYMSVPIYVDGRVTSFNLTPTAETPLVYPGWATTLSPVVYGALNKHLMGTRVFDWTGFDDVVRTNGSMLQVHAGSTRNAFRLFIDYNYGDRILFQTQCGISGSSELTWWANKWQTTKSLLSGEDITTNSDLTLTKTYTDPAQALPAILTGVNITHANSVTALTTQGMRKIAYDANGHITASTAFASADVSSLLNLLATGSSTPTDNDYYIAQYAGGGTTTTTYHRRPVSALWNLFKTKITVTTSGSGSVVTGVSVSNGAFTVTKGSVSDLSPKALTKETLANTSGTFFFSGTSLLDNVSYDWVGIQAGYAADKWQLTSSGSQMFMRQNDSGGTDSTNWTDWKGILMPASITGEKGITVTTTKTTFGSGATAESYDSGVKIGIGTSLKIAGITRNTTVYGTDNPKIFFGNSNESQNIELQFTDHDSIVNPASLTLVGNQGNECFFAPRICAKDDAAAGTGTSQNLALTKHGLYSRSYRAGTSQNHAQYVFRTFDGKANSANGQLIAICGGGLTIIGGGESAFSLANLIDDDQTTTSPGKLTPIPNSTSEGGEMVGDTENMIVAADQSIYFLSNCGTVANRSGWFINTLSKFIPLKNKTHDIGTTDHLVNNVYASNFVGYESSAQTTATLYHLGLVFKLPSTDLPAWSRGMVISDSGDNRLGGIGMFGTTTDLSYIWIGQAYNNTWCRFASTNISVQVPITKSITTYTYIAARDNAIVYSNYAKEASNSHFYPASFSKSQSGGWAIGTVSNSNALKFSYTSDTDYDSNTNASKTYDISTDGRFSGSATKLYVTTNTATTGTTFRMLFATNTSTAGDQSIQNAGGLYFYSKEGTASEQGTAQITLGNSVASGAAGNRAGALALYSSSAYYGTLTPLALTANRGWYIPDEGGYIMIQNQANPQDLLYQATTSATGSQEITITDLFSRYKVINVVIRDAAYKTGSTTSEYFGTTFVVPLKFVKSKSTTSAISTTNPGYFVGYGYHPHLSASKQILVQYVANNKIKFSIVTEGTATVDTTQPLGMISIYGIY